MSLRRREHIYPNEREKFIIVGVGEEYAGDSKAEFCKRLMENEEIMYAEIHPLYHTVVRIVVDSTTRFDDVMDIIKRELGSLFFMDMREISSFYPSTEKDWRVNNTPRSV